MKIRISFQDIHSNITFEKRFNQVIEKIVKAENKKLGEINLVFTSNEKILEINKEYLNHTYFTDVITFNNNKRSLLGGDIFISVEQVILNSEKFKVTMADEFCRVIIHGILHLAGYNDKSDSEKSTMRDKEDIYLCWLRNLVILKLT